MFKNILFCTDGSDNTKCAERNAFKLAKESGGTVHIISVADTTDEFEALAPGLTDSMLAKAREVAEGAVTRAAEAGVKAEAIVRSGEPHERVLQVAQETGADVIVLGTHGRKGFMNVVMGSVTRQVIAQAPIPVLVIHSRFCVI
jgi:nucleotide-binding universal stress UspA family protein